MDTTPKEGNMRSVLILWQLQPLPYTCFGHHPRWHSALLNPIMPTALQGRSTPERIHAWRLFSSKASTKSFMVELQDRKRATSFCLRTTLSSRRTGWWLCCQKEGGNVAVEAATRIKPKQYFIKDVSNGSLPCFIMTFSFYRIKTWSWSQCWWGSGGSQAGYLWPGAFSSSLWRHLNHWLKVNFIFFLPCR